MDADRILRPLDEARAPIDELDGYESPVALAEALRATWLAVERTLRGLLRADPSAPDDIRMRALSPGQLPFDEVMAELRRRDLVSLRLAGQVHAMQQAVARAEDAKALRASDADVALHLVQQVRSEVNARWAPDGAPTNGGEAPEASDTELPAASDDATPWPRARGGWLPLEAGPQRRVAALAGVVVVLLVMVAIGVHMVGRSPDMSRGIAAFEAGQTGVAERYFRGALESDPESVTARLYIARIVRQQGRFDEAAALLREAAATAPRDAAVRRELGWLFLDLDQPAVAAEQFREATELEPGAAAAWVGLVEALRRAGDPAADDVFRRAPEEARALMAGPRTP